MKTIALILSFVFGFGVRWLRWLAILQQKEYRFDRISLFLRTKEGKSDLLRLFPKKTDLSRTGLKRPRLTPRILTVFILNILLIGVWIYWGMGQFNSLEVVMMKFGGWFIWLLILYLFLPLIILISNLPTYVVSMVVTNWYLKKASQNLQSYKPKVIGITGSFGKTSTKQLLGHVLGGENRVFITPGSFNTRLSIAQSITKHYRGQSIVVIEYGAYSQNEIAELTKWFPPDEAVITGLTIQHLGLFGGIEQIVKAKSELVSALPEGAKVYFWADDEGVRQIVELGKKGKKLELIPYRSSGSNVTRLQSAGISPHGHLECVVDGLIIKTKLIGEHYLPAVVAAITIGANHGVKYETLWQRIAEFEPTDNFIQRKQLVQDSSLIDDGGSSNPVGFESVISLAERMMARKKILVTSGIIDLGNQSEEVHHKLAEYANSVFDQVLYVGEAGKKQFALVLKNKLVEDRAKQKEVLGQIESGSLIVVEGLMPGWVKILLQKWKLDNENENYATKTKAV